MVEIFTQAPKYQVKITHPNKNAGLITVLSVPAPRGPHSEQRGILHNGEEFIAEVDEREDGSAWAHILECPTNPDTEGYYCALRYNGQVFAEWNLWDGTIRLAHVKTDYEVSGKSRPTRNNARGLPPKAKEVDYLAGKYAKGSGRFVAGLPMTIQISGPDSTIMDNNYLQWIISLQQPMPAGELLRNLQGFFRDDRAFNNFQYPKFESSRDSIGLKPEEKYHISGEKVTIINKIKLPPLITSKEGQQVHILGGAVKKWGQSMRPIEIINTAENYTRFHPSTHPHLFFTPTISGRRPIFSGGIFTGKYDESLVYGFPFDINVLPIHGRGTSIGYIRSEYIQD